MLYTPNLHVICQIYFNLKRCVVLIKAGSCITYTVLLCAVLRIISRGKYRCTVKKSKDT